MARLGLLTRSTLLALLLAGAQDLRADVFSLFQSPVRSGTWSNGAAAEVLGAKKLWSEPVLINGSEVSLGMSLVDSSFESCIFQLRSSFPKASYAGNSDSLVMETKLDNGRRLRLFLVQMPGIYPVIQFSMEIPADLSSTPQWPSNIPLPPSSTPVTVMQFPNRGSTYGLFSSALSPDQALAELRKSMLSNGWHVAGDDGGSNESGGDIYLKDRPLEITIVGANAGQDGKTKGSVYTRSIGKQQ